MIISNRNLIEHHEDIPILYEDNHIISVFKPAGLAVQGNIRDKSDSLDNKLKLFLKRKYQKPGNVFLGIVHRLDKPVHGVMVFAKTSKAASRLSDQIRKKQIEKRYLAIVKGKAEVQAQLCDFLFKDHERNKVMIANKNTLNAQFAELTYKTIATHKDYSLLEITLLTGRSHQIRVQLCSRGLPIIGDRKYGIKDGYDIALQSFAYGFNHPTQSTWLEIKAFSFSREEWFYFKNEITRIITS